ncbi:MAG: M16 family metallopeptidase [Myxococcaceae bacterium]
MTRALWAAPLACALAGCVTPGPTEVRDAAKIDLEQVVAIPVPEKPVPPPAPPPPSPVPVPVRPLKTPAPLHTVVLPVHNKPIVSFRLVFHSGAIDDPAGKEGLTALTSALMAQGGTKELSSSQLLEALFPMAAELSASTDKEFTVVEGRVHKDKLERFFKIFGDVLLEPRFDPREFERLRTDAISAIRNDLRGQDDESLGKVALDALLYSGHPYAHFNGGTVQGLTALTLDDVKAQWKAVFTQDRLVIGLAGGVDRGLEEKVRARLSALPPTGAPPVALPPAPGVRGRVLVLQRDTLSTAGSMGFSWSLRRDDPDFYPVAFAASYLGEHRQLSGVLFTELREKRGLNYGDYAYAEHFLQEGWSTLPAVNVGRAQQDFTIWVRPVEPQNAVFAARGAVYFLGELIARPAPGERFETARGFLIGYTRLWEQTDQRRLGYAIDELYYGTPGFLEGYRKALAAMTPESVHAAVRRHLSTDRLNFVFVTKDARGLASSIASQAPSPITYPTPKAAEVLEADKAISRFPLPTHPALIEVKEAQQFMER